MPLPSAEQLDNLRQSWEKGCTCLLHVVKNHSPDYQERFTVLALTKAGRYRVQRYMPMGNNWVVSVDVDWTSDIQAVFAYLQTWIGE